MQIDQLLLLKIKRVKRNERTQLAGRKLVRVKEKKEEVAGIKNGHLSKRRQLVAATIFC